MKKTFLIPAFIAGGVAGFLTYSKSLGKNQLKKIDTLTDGNFKFKEFYDVLNQWLRVKQEGKNISEYLLKNNYRNIAIYGMRELGEALLEELKDTEVNVKYAIDQNAEDIYVPIDVLRPDDDLEPVDAVVVTAIHWYEAIEINMKDKLGCPVISLGDIVYEL